MKKTIALTLLGLASALALTTADAKAVESLPNEAQTKTEMSVDGAGIQIGTTNTEGFRFDNFVIDGKNKKQTVNANGELSVNVSDLRGTHDGWAVSAMLSPLTYNSIDGDTDEITTATVLLNNGTLSDSFGEALTLKEGLTISNAETLISSAAEGSGMGNWTHNWTAGNIILDIPAKEARDMYAGQYSTTITWTLAAAP